jgi:hypothetical protein
MSALILALALLLAPQFELSTSGGETLSGELVELSAKQVVVQAAGGPQTVPTGQLAAVRSSSKPGEPAQPAVRVELVDGSSLHAISYSVSDGDATIALAGGEVTLTTRSIASVRFKQQSDEQQAQWEAMLAGPQNGDLLVIRKNEALDYLAGVLGDVSAETVRFTLDDESLPVKRPRVEGLVYFHPARAQLPPSFCRLTDQQGSRVEVESARIEDGRLKLVTPAGLKWNLPLEQVAAIDFKIQFLSDLEPESARWTPLVGRSDAVPSLAALYQPRMNQSFEGGELRLGGKTYAKGICLHSRSELVYRLPAGKYSSLAAIAGIDDRVRPYGDARLTIAGDGKPLFDATLTGQDDPLEIRVDLKGVRRLVILVDFGGDLDVSDYVNLCEARILP